MMWTSSTLGWSTPMQQCCRSRCDWDVSLLGTGYSSGCTQRNILITSASASLLRGGASAQCATSIGALQNQKHTLHCITVHSPHILIVLLLRLPLPAEITIDSCRSLNHEACQAKFAAVQADDRQLGLHQKQLVTLILLYMYLDTVLCALKHQSSLIVRGAFHNPDPFTKYRIELSGLTRLCYVVRNTWLTSHLPCWACHGGWISGTCDTEGTLHRRALVQQAPF